VYAFDTNSWQRENLLQRVNDHALQLENDELIDRGIKLHEHILICSNLKEAVENADFVFEAASERIDIKKALLKEATAVCRSEAILGTNTLNLRLEDIIDDALFSERILGIRFLYPVFGIPVLECTISRSTSEEAIIKSQTFFSSMGKSLVMKANYAQPLMLNALEVEKYQRECREKRVHTMRNHHGDGVEHRTMLTNSSHSHSATCTENMREEESNPCKPTSSEGSTTVLGSEERTDECVICNENRINAILFPCRHMWLCLACADKLKSQSYPCPACRADIQEVISVFKP